MRFLLVTALAAGAFGILAVPKAEARIQASGLDASSIVEKAQCVTRVVRTRRPNGSVVVRRVQNCGAPAVRYSVPSVTYAAPVVRVAPACRNVRTTVRNGNQTVVRTVRRC